MKKNKLLMLSGLVAGATTLGSIATLVSCGDKNHEKDDLLSIDEESKHVTIEDGNVEHTFTFTASRKITKEDTITAEAEYVDEESHDFDVSLKIIEPEETEGTNELKVLATLYKKGVEPYNIPSGSYTKLNIRFTLPNGKEQTIEGFDFNFKTVDGGLTVINNSVLTMPKSTITKIEFNLNDAFLDTDECEIYPEILDEECSKSTLDLKLDYAAVTGHKCWEVSGDKLIIWFKLENASEDTEDNVKFNLRLRCASKSKSNTSVYWEQTFKGTAGQKAFLITYSNNNFGMDSSDIDDSPLNHNAGDNHKKFNLYYYKGMAESNPTIEISELKTEIKSSISYGESYETESHTYRVLPITITFTKTGGETLTDDQDITFKITAKYEGTDVPGVQPETIPYDKDKMIKFCYRRARLSNDLDEFHPSRYTKPGSSENIDFVASLLEGSPSGLTYDYDIITDVEHSTKNVKAIGRARKISLEEGETEFPFAVNMLAPAGDSLVDGDYAIFDIKITCYKGDEVQWMQQTSGKTGPGAFTVTYHDTINIPSYDVNTGWESNAAEFVFTYNPDNMTINDESFNWTTTAHQGVEESQEPTLSTSDGKGIVDIQLKSESDSDIPFDSYLKGNITFDATAPKWPGAESAGEMFDFHYYSTNEVTVNYKGIIQYTGTKDIVTPAGQNKAELEFSINPEAIPLITSIDVEPLSKEADFYLDVDKDGIVLNTETNILTVPVFGHNKDESVIVGGQHCTNMGLKFTFTMGEDKAQKTFNNFSFSYTSLIDDNAEKSKVTDPGLHQTQYTLHSRVDIPAIQDDKLKIEYVDDPSMFYEDIPVDVHLDEKSLNRNIVFEVRSLENISPTTKYTFDIIIEDEYLGIKERVNGFDFTYTDNKIQYLGTEGGSSDRVFELAVSDTETQTIESPLLKFEVEGYSQSQSSLFRFSIEQALTDVQVSISGGQVGYDSPSTATFKVLLGGKQALTEGQHQAFSVKVEKLNEEQQVVWTQTIHGFGLVVAPESKADELDVKTKTEVMVDYTGKTQPALKAYKNGKPTLPKGTKAGGHYKLKLSRKDWESTFPEFLPLETDTWKLGTYENPEYHVPYLHYSGVKIYVENSKGDKIPLVQTDFAHRDDGDWYQSQGGPVTIKNESLLANDWTLLVIDLYLADDVTKADTDFYITLGNR